MAMRVGHSPHILDMQHASHPVLVWKRGRKSLSKRVAGRPVHNTRAHVTLKQGDLFILSL